jgi:hypothetical protein
VFLYTHIRSLNVCHFGNAEAKKLKMWLRGHLEWQHLFTKFPENPPISSKVISGGHRQTDRQAGWRFDRPTLSFKSRIKHFEY